MANPKTTNKTGHRKTNRATRTTPKPRTSTKKTKHGASRNKGQNDSEIPAVIDSDEKEDWEIEAITKEEVQNGKPGFKVHWRNTWIPAEELSAKLKNQFLAARAEGVSIVINPQEGEDIEAVLEQKLENGKNFTKSYFQVRWRDTWVPKTEMSDPSRAPSASQEDSNQVVHPSGERSRRDSLPLTPAMSIRTSSPAENIATPEPPPSLVRNGAVPMASAAPSVSQGQPTPPPVVASATFDERFESNNQPLAQAKAAMPSSPAENTATPLPRAPAAGSGAASREGSTPGAFLPSTTSSECSRLLLTPVISAEKVATPKPPSTSTDPKEAEAVLSVSQEDISTVASAADSDTQSQNTTAELNKLVLDSSHQPDSSEGRNKRQRSSSVASSERDRPAKRTALLAPWEMSQFRDQPSWEPYVREIDAVEKNANAHQHNAFTRREWWSWRRFTFGCGTFGRRRRRTRKRVVHKCDSRVQKRVVGGATTAWREQEVGGRKIPDINLPSAEGADLGPTYFEFQLNFRSDLLSRLQFKRWGKT
ncbi:hypothetical protein R3P38DRAFT_3364703 [Favolaschia claudopus]|uniref:Chromo domain-containing protein n=1 Tax=Favolaschia claudopus TaxID=2862362 RepID=A0AAW0AH94_9AGAR